MSAPAAVSVILTPAETTKLFSKDSKLGLQHIFDQLGHVEAVRHQDVGDDHAAQEDYQMAILTHLFVGLG